MHYGGKRLMIIIAGPKQSNVRWISPAAELTSGTPLTLTPHLLVGPVIIRQISNSSFPVWTLYERIRWTTSLPRHTGTFYRGHASVAADTPNCHWRKGGFFYLNIFHWLAVHFSFKICIHSQHGILEWFWFCLLSWDQWHGSCCLLLPYTTKDPQLVVVWPNAFIYYAKGLHGI